MVSREKQILNGVRLIIIFIFLLIILRLVWLIIPHGASLKNYENPVVASRVVRGTIYDRNGAVLAIETPYYALALHLDKVKDIESIISTISPVIGMDRDEVHKALENKIRYALIKKNLLTSEKDQLESLIQEGLLQGAVIEKRYGRVYPQVYHASQIIGFTNSNNVGLEGIEYTYNEILSPAPSVNEAITYGNDITLTLDMNIQFMLDINIQQMVKEHLAQSAVGIIIDSTSGAIVAVTQYPWYDNALYATSSEESRKNSFVTDMREPGSVFKIFSLAAELDSQAIDADEHFYCDGVYTFTGEDGNLTTINCVSPHGDVDPTAMIARSCNGAVAAWSHAMTKDTFRDYIVNFGFTHIYDLPLTGVSGGYLAPTTSWSDRSKATISFGQEIAVTPLQIVVAASAIANGGELVTPYLISNVTTKEGEVVSTYEKPSSTHNVISKETASIILEGMEEATVPGGTATKTFVEGVRVASKTGTAQVADPNGGGYLKNTFLASTLSIFPIDNPKYIIYVAALDPKGDTIWGSGIASPAIGNVISDMVRSGYITSSAIEEVSIVDEKIN